MVSWRWAAKEASNHGRRGPCRAIHLACNPESAQKCPPSDYRQPSVGTLADSSCVQLTVTAYTGGLSAVFCLSRSSVRVVTRSTATWQQCRSAIGKETVVDWFIDRRPLWLRSRTIASPLSVHSPVAREGMPGKAFGIPIGRDT